MNRFRFVSEHVACYGVKRLCRVVKVSRSGYYAWQYRKANPSPRTRRDAHLVGVIRRVHERSRRIYGAPRVHAELRYLGEHVGRKRVARLMRSAGIAGVHRRRGWRRGRPDTAPAPDLVKRDFNPRRIDQLWAADITYLRTHEGWLHLAVVLDLYSRKVIGWAMATRPTTDLVLDAVMMAFTRRRPDQQVVHHSDRGCQYTSLRFAHTLRDLGLAQSMGSTADCYDNSAVESFFATLKTELVHRDGPWTTRDLLRAAVFDYIEGFYNRHRIMARHGYQSPTTFETTTAATAA